MAPALLSGYNVCLKHAEPYGLTSHAVAGYPQKELSRLDLDLLVETHECQLRNGQFEGACAAFAGLEGNSVEAFQFAYGAGYRSGDVAYVELGDLNGVVFARIGQRECHVDGLVGGVFVAVELYVAIFESRVRQSVSEREQGAETAVEIVRRAAE